MANKRVIINLTNHTPTPDQVVAGVVDVPNDLREQIKALITFNELPDRDEIQQRAKALAELVEDMGFTTAMIGGAGYLMPALVESLKKRNIRPLFAFTKRIVVENEQDDGSIKKTVIFRFEGFVEV